MTQLVLLFLAHRTQALRLEAATWYLADRMAQADRMGLRGRIMQGEELCALTLGDIQQFYGIEPKAEKQDSKSEKP